MYVVGRAVPNLVGQSIAMITTFWQNPFGRTSSTVLRDTNET